MATPNFLHPILPSDASIRRTLLYGPPPGRPSPLPVPQHRRLNLPPEQRAIIERNFAWQTFTRPSRSWSWEKTEQYVHYKDVLTVAYLYDYPVRDWVIRAEDARFAVEALLAREAMRRLGGSVFAIDTPFSWWMSGVILPELREEVDEDMRVELEEEIREEVGEDMEVKHEPVTPRALPPLSNLPDTEVSITTKKEIHEDATAEERAIEEDPEVNPSPRRSARVSERKLKGQWDQQVKEESMEESTELEPPTPQGEQVSIAPTESGEKNIVETKQEDDEHPRRRSTRIAPKRNFPAPLHYALGTRLNSPYIKISFIESRNNELVREPAP